MDFAVKCLAMIVNDTRLKVPGFRTETCQHVLIVKAMIGNLLLVQPTVWSGEEVLQRTRFIGSYPHPQHVFVAADEAKAGIAKRGAFRSQASVQVFQWPEI